MWLSHGGTGWPLPWQEPSWTAFRGPHELWLRGQWEQLSTKVWRCSWICQHLEQQWSLQHRELHTTYQGQINGRIHSWPKWHFHKYRFRCVLLLIQTSAVDWFRWNFEMLNFLCAEGHFSFDPSDKIYFCRKPNDLSDLKHQLSCRDHLVFSYFFTRKEGSHMSH